jgi:hypothetical protein
MDLSLLPLVEIAMDRVSPSDARVWLESCLAESVVRHARKWTKFTEYPPRLRAIRLMGTETRKNRGNRRGNRPETEMDPGNLRICTFV